MSYEAIDPASGHMQPIRWFLERGLTEGRCDICEKKMTIRGDKTPDGKPHFWHGPSPSNCPASSNNKLRYASLAASATDHAAGLLLEAQVKEHLHTFYLACQAIIDAPIRKTDFIDAVRCANKINVL